MGQTVVWFFVVLVVFLGAVLCWLPRFSRQDLFFAVTVPAEFPASEGGRAILRRFRGQVVLATMAAAGLAIWGAANGRFALVVAAPPLHLLATFGAFLAARRNALDHAAEPTPLREARLEPRQIRVPGRWIGELLPLGILGGTAAVLRANWERIPQRFPVHWGIDGRPNGWSTRTAGGVYGPLMIGAATIALLVVMIWGIVRWTRRVHVTGTAAEADVARERRYLQLLLFSEYVIAAILSWTALLPLRPLGQQSPSPFVPLGMLVALFLVLLLIVVRTPAVPAPAEGGRPVGDRTEDRYWKAGVFYVNPQDPALLVEKRFGVGYTINLGHWIAWLILAAIIALPLAMFLRKVSH